MTTSVLPVQPNVPDQKFSAQLAGLTFTLTLVWNPRAGQWSLTMEDSEGELFSGHGLVLDAPVLHQYRPERGPQGEFFLVDTAGTGVEPGLEDLGERVLLVFSED